MKEEKKMKYFASQICHFELMDSIEQKLSLENAKDLNQWKKDCYSKLDELLGDYPEFTEPNLDIEYEFDRGDFTEIRFTFDTEKYSTIPCHLLIPKNAKKPVPVVICLQGHTSGMHISLGRVKEERDNFTLKFENDFGIQAVKRGYAALVMEQRCFGERADTRPERDMRPTINECAHATMTALLLGRTMIRERVWDVSRVIDILEKFDAIDMTRIGCMGNSGGGVITYFAGCMDERIKVSMPSGSVCNFYDSFMSIDHCVDNYIPHAYKYFEMGDLACLVAPRPMVVVAGTYDIEFPIEGAVKCFKKIKKVYEAFGCGDKCELVVGEAGHKFYPALAWDVFDKFI
jgi:dienelactone hydrolase